MLFIASYVVVATFVAISITFLIFEVRKSKGNQIVPPPGSKGLPFIGETLQLLIPSKGSQLQPFIKKRVQKYGPIFQTHIVGSPVVISTDQDFNRHLINQEGLLVEMWYLDSYSKIFGHVGEERTTATGYIHKYIRRRILNSFGSESLKSNLLNLVEEFVRNSLQAWSTKESVEVGEALSIELTDFMAKQTFGYDPENSKINLGKQFHNFTKSIFSFPINIPGTTYNRCLKSKEIVMNVMRDAIRSRVKNQEMYQGDFLDDIIKDSRSEKFVTEEFILHIMFGLLFASGESSHMGLILIFKFLTENPHVVEELEAEHQKILRNKEDPQSPLTMDEVKSMTFTLHVIYESLRIGSLALGVFRKALRDIEVNGFTIPKGWTIILAISQNNYNPDIYKDPLVFNPWRWKNMEQDYISRNFTPFGGGTRQCAGAEFSKVLLITFIHVLVTKYRWTKIKGGELYRNPFLQCKNGFHVKLFEKAER